jgi:hypothetical protein
MTRVPFVDRTKTWKDLPEWMHWKDDGPAPASWWATDPKTGERAKIYRSYGDYCDD